jgi:hypothetical protein
VVYFLSMARPRKDPGEICSYAELAVAGGAPLTKRDVQQIMEAKGDLLNRSRNARAVKRVAVIGAIMLAGVPLISAAKLAEAVRHEFNQPDGEAPSGLNHWHLRLSSEAIDRWAEWGEGDYFKHLILVEDSSSTYERSSVLESDALLEIIDRHLVTISNVGFPKPELVGWLEWGERGTDVRIVHATERVTGPDPLGLWSEAEIEAWQRQMAVLQADAEAVRAKAVARVTINVSLAIRNAFDRLYDHRHRGGEA